MLHTGGVMCGEYQMRLEKNAVTALMEDANILASALFYCSSLENSLVELIHEAHTKSLDGVDVCDHSANVCYCSYHSVLDNALSLLRGAGVKSDFIAGIRVERRMS